MRRIATVFLAILFAVILLSELWDMRRFPDRNHLASYAGFAPYLVGSGDKETTVSAGSRKQKMIHYVLIQSAWRASRYDPEMVCLFGKSRSRGLSPQKAACIIAKKILFIARAVLLEDREYRPAGAAAPLQAGADAGSGAVASCPPPSPTR